MIVRPDVEGKENLPINICPQGRLRVYKKCFAGVIVTLDIPEDAPRSNATGRKCRAAFADVVAVDGQEFGVGISLYDLNFIYRVGERVVAHYWEEDRWVECGGGIYFYLTREEAEAHG